MKYPIGTIFIHNESGTPYLVKDKEIFLNGGGVLAPCFDLALSSRAMLFVSVDTLNDFTIVYPNSTGDRTESI